MALVAVQMQRWHFPGPGRPHQREEEPRGVLFSVVELFSSPPRCALPELMPATHLSPSQTELLFIFLLFCLVGVGKNMQKSPW